MRTDKVPTPVDVAVLGAGPAGAAAARLLAMWGHSVVVLSRTPRHAPLAESLPPSCAKLFDEMGVRHLVDAAGFVRATGNTVYWADRGRRVEMFEAGQRGYQVRRDALDALLIDAAQASGAMVHRDAAVRSALHAGDDLWSIAYDSAAGSGEARARWVLDCTGRAGVIARNWRRAEHTARTIAVIGVWESASRWPIENESHTIVESYDGGWAWSVPVSATQRYVTVMLDPSMTTVPGQPKLAEAYRTQLDRTVTMRVLVEKAALIEGPWGTDASPYSAERFNDSGVLLVGDAASFVDPLSSFGVKKALASAWLASVVVHTALVDRAMADAAIQLFAERERAMYNNLQRQSAELSREAAGAHESGFWSGRADAAEEQAHDDFDVAALRSDPRVLAAFEELKSRPSVNLRAGDSVAIVERAAVRGHRIALQQHLASPFVPNGVRYCRNVDLVLITQLAARYDQVPDLYDAYNRAAPPAPLPDFLGALSTLIALKMLVLA